MFRLKHIPPAEASGPVAEAYAMFPQGMEPPLPMQMYSASPGLMEAMGDYMKYFMNHQRLSFPLLALIRYLAATYAGHAWCEKFNGGLLKKAGMSEEDLAAVIEDPGRAPIEDNEKALLAFVIKTVKDPAGVTGQDIDRLRELGWHDSDILDATQMGANMLAARIMNVAFMA